MVFNIREIRKRKGLTQAALARLSGVTRDNINRYENGKKVPEISTLVKLRNVLGCTLDDLVREE